MSEDQAETREEWIERRVYEEAISKGQGFVIAYGLIQVAAALNNIAEAIREVEE